MTKRTAYLNMNSHSLRTGHEERGHKRHRDQEHDGRKRKHKRQQGDSKYYTWVEKNIDLDGEAKAPIVPTAISSVSGDRLPQSLSESHFPGSASHDKPSMHRPFADRIDSPGAESKLKRSERGKELNVNHIGSDSANHDATIWEMLREERYRAGTTDQKNLDAQFAQAIMSDGKFEDNLGYLDDNAEKLSRRKMRSDAMKRQFAIHDYRRTQSAMATCQFCFGENDSPPKAPVIAMGTRVYLSCTLHEELVQGHCLIVPIQHHLNMLEADTDVWDEVQNFMKCLIRMYAEDDKGVIFYETVISFKRQKHTFIECLPLPWPQFEEMPIYFKESILQSEGEWSQNKKLIDFSARPGGFRRVMVPNLPYFMVQFDHKGEKGYGHVIEGDDDRASEGEGGFSEGVADIGKFPRYFAAEIIGNLLGVEPRKWLRPRQLGIQNNKSRIQKFKSKYDEFDWTGMIGQ